MVRVAKRIDLGVPTHVRHSDCLGAPVWVLPGPGGYGAGLRGSDGLVAASGGSTVSGQRTYTIGRALTHKPHVTLTGVAKHGSTPVEWTIIVRRYMSTNTYYSRLNREGSAFPGMIVRELGIFSSALLVCCRAVSFSHYQPQNLS